MAADTASVARSLYTIFNDKAFEQLRNIVADTCEWRNMATGESFRGAEGMIAFQQGWAAAFPGSKTEILSVTADGNRAVVEFVGRGIHGGVFRTPLGDIPPTGKRIEVRFCDVIEVRDGKVTAGRTYFDAPTFAKQMGLA
jgi:steroid delta-isomerase-like uncharacterized protein